MEFVYADELKRGNRGTAYLFLGEIGMLSPDYDVPRLHAEENSTYLIKGEPYASFPSGPFTRRPDIFSYCC